MAKQPNQKNEVREQILSNPSQILEDRDIMRALISSDEVTRGDNVIDLRSMALERLDARLDQLEDTHQTVIAAAYNNVASTSRIHRATHSILEPHTFAEFLTLLEGELANCLSVASARLILESSVTSPKIQAQLEAEFGTGVSFCSPGGIQEYITQGRVSQIRTVTLRGLTKADPALFGDASGIITSEALLKLDLGETILPAMLVLGSVVPDQFIPRKGADLLHFFAGCFERVLRRWLK